jgi:uncharacterized protein YidB (DUF937 family)
MSAAFPTRKENAMGFLDSVLGSVMGNTTSGGANSPMTQVLQGLLQQHGGLGGLVGQLSQGGLAQQVQSWVGPGQNVAVTAEQVIAALGHGKVGEIAQQLGVDHQQAGGLLAQVLPQLINHLTPTGQLPTGSAQMPTSDVLGSALGALFGNR